jgi:hypothetical protein
MRRPGCRSLRRSDRSVAISASNGYTPWALVEKLPLPRRLLSASGVGAMLLAAFLGGAMATPAAAGAAPTVTRLALRVYNVYGLPPSELETARTTVRDLFEQAGIETTWRNCLSTGRDPCSDRLSANEIVIRLIRSPLDPRMSSADLTLGYSFVGPDVTHGSFTMVYPDRVDKMAQGYGRDRGLLIGWAMGHELGHLLLGTTTHPDSGLMRARWSGRPMFAPVAQDWMFLPGEAQQLRDAAFARSIAARPIDQLAAVGVSSSGVVSTLIEH